MSGRLPPLLAAAAASRGPRPGRGGPWTVVVRAATPTLREKAVDWHIVGVSVAMMGPCASPRPAGGWYLSHRTAESGCGLGRFDGSALLLPPRASPAPPFPAGLAAPPRPSMPSPLPRRTGSGRRRGKGGAFPPPAPRLWPPRHDDQPRPHLLRPRRRRLTFGWAVLLPPLPLWRRPSAGREGAPARRNAAGCTTVTAATACRGMVGCVPSGGSAHAGARRGWQGGRERKKVARRVEERMGGPSQPQEASPQRWRRPTRASHTHRFERPTKTASHRDGTTKKRRKDYQSTRFPVMQPPPL